MTPVIDPRKAFPRRFVPAGVDAGRWEEIERIGASLLAREPGTVADLERWLEDISELSACVSEEGTRRYVAMTLHTDDPERERAHLEFIREIEPRWKRLVQRLNEAYLRNPHRRGLRERYRELDRRVENRVALYREENLPLEVTEGELSQQYQKLRGAMTVVYRGEEHTLEQLERYLEDPDRAVRREAWELGHARMLQDRDALDALFDRLREVRGQIARNAGFASYLDYSFRARARFDYGPEDCLRFHDGVEARFVPIAERLGRERRSLLGVDALRPWDQVVDPLGRTPLPTFDRTDDLLDRCERVFRAVSPEFGAYFRFMREQGLLDLERRKGKAPGGYQRTFEERRWPFIFSNVPAAHDVDVVLHEGGHAFHTIVAREEPLLAYRHAPLEFAEVASMGMELLGARHFDAIYPRPEDSRRARRRLLEGILLPRGMPWIATIDAFQHWLYTHPAHTVEERREAWVRTYRRFHPAVEWSNFEDALASLWHRQLHIFLVPFYYIEYGIAQLGALRLWLRARADPRDAVARYRTALALGGSRPLPELFAAAGARFAFDEETMAPLAEALEAELREIPYA